MLLKVYFHIFKRFYNSEIICIKMQTKGFKLFEFAFIVHVVIMIFGIIIILCCLHLQYVVYNNNNFMAQKRSFSCRGYFEVEFINSTADARIL